MSSDDALVSGLPGPPTSKTAYVLERLRAEIARGEVQPGDPLRQSDLAHRFGVSPTPVREALRLLEAEGSVSYSPHRGATVNELSHEHLGDLYELRATVEALGARLAAGRMTDEQLARARELHERTVAASSIEDRKQLGAWNRELHLLICRSGSDLVAEHSESLWRMIPTRLTLMNDPAITDEFNEQHEQLIVALEHGDGDRAEEIMREHIMSAAAHRRDIVERGAS
ncbi:GntR family transcriptional regulator [Egibacter rhizosphaerae]|nr:GntR family transcriptional regulator [Egibacter rhizosphaerae]